MDSIENRLLRRFPNYNAMDRNVFDGVVEIAKEFAKDVAQDALNRAASSPMEVLKDGVIRHFKRYSEDSASITETEIITL